MGKQDTKIVPVPQSLLDDWFWEIYRHENVCNYGTLKTPLNSMSQVDGRFAYVQMYRERIWVQVQIVMEWIVFLIAVYKIQWEMNGTPQTAIIDFLVVLQTCKEELHRWLIFYGVQSNSCRTTKENTNTTSFFKEETKSFVPFYTFHPSQYRLWELSSWLKKTDILSQIPWTSWLHMFRSFVTTVLEDDVIPMTDPSFDHGYWKQIRFVLENVQHEIKTWQDVNDRENSDRLLYRLLRIVRPFSHRLPILCLFFQKSLEKTPMIRVLCLHLYQSLQYVFHYGTNLHQYGESDLGNAWLKIYYDLYQAWQDFFKDLTVCGLSALGNREHWIDHDCMVMQRVGILPLYTDPGPTKSLQRSHVRTFILLHFCQRTMFMNMLFHEFPFHELVQKKLEVLMKCHSKCYDELRTLPENEIMPEVEKKIIISSNNK